MRKRSGWRLRAHVRSFFQGNRFLFEELARTVVELVPPGGPVLDLYAGVGLFTLPLAAGASEWSPSRRAPPPWRTRRPTSKRRTLKNVRIAARRRGGGLDASCAQSDEHIVLDPPRTGAGPGVVERIAARQPRTIVYVSCDPPTLGRDLALFARSGYRPDIVRAFDLFPDTYHLETVVRLVAG